MRTAPFNIIPWKVSKEQSSITSKELIHTGKLIKSKHCINGVGHYCLKNLMKHLRKFVQACFSFISS
jgi:hypothetical protein